MSTNRLPQPRLRVTLETADGQLVEYEIQTDNRDAVRFDLIRTRMGWPDGQAAPVLWMTLNAYSALKRSGEYDGKPEAFLDACVSVEPIKDDGGPVDPADPTAGVMADPTQPVPAPA